MRSGQKEFSAREQSAGCKAQALDAMRYPRCRWQDHEKNGETLACNRSRGAAQKPECSRRIGLVSHLYSLPDPLYKCRRNLRVSLISRKRVGTLQPPDP